MLIVEDDPAWRTLYRLAFEAEFEIFEAADGREGLSLVDSAQPDVILLDLRMPRMDGLDLLRQLERRGRHPPIVVCSGVINEGDHSRIPGVELTLKTADLKDVRRALRLVVPDPPEPLPPPKRISGAEGTFWRD